MATDTRSLIVALVALMMASVANAQIKQVTLPYALNALEPSIDTQTMQFHYGTHYATYVNNTNAALANATGIANSSNLTALIMNIQSLPSPLNTTIRNQGGGAWNHALYFKHLTAPGSDANEVTALSPTLDKAIMVSFGSLDNLTSEMTTAATKVFGSGWAWLCFIGGAKPPLVVTTTPNQDNPLMGSLPGAPALKPGPCTPILGIDVWEHAYYLKNGPKRADYLKSFWDVVNWAQVSKNLDNAKAGLELDLDEASPDALQAAQATSATSSAGRLVAQRTGAASMVVSLVLAAAYALLTAAVM